MRGGSDIGIMSQHDHLPATSGQGAELGRVHSQRSNHIHLHHTAPALPGIAGIVLIYS